MASWNRTTPSSASALDERIARITQLFDQQHIRKQSLIVQIQSEKARLGMNDVAQQSGNLLPLVQLQAQSNAKASAPAALVPEPSVLPPIGKSPRKFKLYDTAMVENAMRTPSAIRKQHAGPTDQRSDDALSSADTRVSSRSFGSSWREAGVQKCVRPFNCACTNCFKHPAKARNFVGPLMPRRDIVGFSSYSDARSRIGPLLYRDGS